MVDWAFRVLYLTVHLQSSIGPIAPLAYHLYVTPLEGTLKETFQHLREGQISSDVIMSNLITQLELINQNIADDAAPDVTPISDTTMDALKRLRAQSFHHHFLIQNVAKVISQCEFYGVERFEFSYRQGCTNQQKLDEINVPDELIPDEYFDQMDAELDAKLQRFIRKAQLVYCMFRAGGAYNRLYYNEAIKSGIQDDALSYQDFKARVQGIANKRGAQALSTFNMSEENKGFVPAFILNLFASYKMNILEPTVLEYEKLIRRIAARGESHDLEALLHHPVLDTVAINIDARVNDTPNALAWAKEGARKYPEKASEYEACAHIIERYKAPSTDVPKLLYL